MDFTYKNHYKFGWGNRLYNFQDTNQPYWTSYSPAEYDPGPNAFRVESVRAAKLIAESAKKPLAVMFSGGLDSEIVVRSLMEAGADFECIITQYNYNGQEHVNEYDTRYALDFIKQHGLRYRTHVLDIENFFLNDYPQIAARFNNCNTTWLLHTHVLSQFPDYHVICGGGDIQLMRWAYLDRRDPPANQQQRHGLYIQEKSHIVCAYKITQDIGSNCSLRFFRHTPELMLAWLHDRDVQHFIKYERSLGAYERRTVQQMDFLHLKPWVLHRYWDDLTPRVKYHGFEHIHPCLYIPITSTGVDAEMSTPRLSKIKSTMQEVFQRHFRHESTYKIDLPDLLDQLRPK